MRRRLVGLLVVLGVSGALTGCPDKTPPPVAPLPSPPTERPTTATVASTLAPTWDAIGALELETRVQVRTPEPREEVRQVRHVVVTREPLTVRTETTVNGVALAAAVSSRVRAETPRLLDRDATDLGAETVRTPAGTFECRHLKAGDTDAWLAPGLPVFVRTDTVSDTVSSSTVLTHIDRR